jgi:hypothetical protein
MTPQCGDAGGTTKAGQPCRGRLNLSPVNGLCLEHDPDRVEARRVVHVAGARAKGRFQREETEAERAVVVASRQLETFDGLIRLQAVNLAETDAGRRDTRTSEAVSKGIREQRMNLHDRDTLKELSRLRKDIAEARKDRAPSRTPVRSLTQVRG